jgi:hypothetical protein
VLTAKFDYDDSIITRSCVLRKLLLGSNAIYAVIRRIGYMLILSQRVAHAAVGLRPRSEEIVSVHGKVAGQNLIAIRALKQNRLRLRPDRSRSETKVVRNPILIRMRLVE